MPRLFHQPPKYSQHKPSKQAVVYWGGRAVYLGPHGSAESHQRYQEFLAEWHAWRHNQLATKQQEKKRSRRSAEQELKSVVTPESLRMKRRRSLPVTLDELIFVYREHARRYYRKDGRVTREAGLVEEITRELGLRHGSTDPEEFGSADLIGLREQLLKEKDWCRDYLNKQVKRIKVMYKWAAQMELCTPAAYERVKMVTGLRKNYEGTREGKGVQCVDDAHVEATLPHLPPLVADMVRLQRLTAARPGEICALRPCDLERGAKVWLYRPESHKTEHFEVPRVIPIGPRAQAVLVPYLDRAPDKHCFCPKDSVAAYRKRVGENRATRRRRAAKEAPKQPKVAPQEKYLTASYRIAIRRACKKAGVPVWTPNQLRHNAATKIRKQYGLEAAQVVCGHTQADVTQIYAERDMEKAIEVAEALG